MMPIQCVTCQHFIEEQKCKAFPNGIPEEIYLNDIDHDHVVDGQIGDYVWTPEEKRK